MKNQVRIIGGRWRSRKISFPDAQGLRPTPDRVRETLFNWLSPYLSGAVCADLFAGTGVLGFESLSRGAKAVVSVDKNGLVINSIREQAQTLQTDAMHMLQADALQVLAQPDAVAGFDSFDIVFADPPFSEVDFPALLLALDQSPRIHSQSLIYLESPQAYANDAIPANWKTLKAKKAGKVFSQLYSKTNL